MTRRYFGEVHRGVAVISASAGVGQLVMLLAAPFLARLYTPDAYGSFAVLLSVVAIAATMGSLRLESAIPLASESDARNLVKSAAISALLVGACCMPVVSALQIPSTGAWPRWGLAVIPYIVWITVMYAVLTTYSLRSRRYVAVARRNLLQQMGTASGQLLAARWLRSSLGLVIGTAVGRSLGVGHLLRESGLLSRSWSTERTQVATLRRFWRFPIVFMPSALLNVGGSQIPLLFVASRYGSEAAGNLTQAQMFASAPAALLGSAVSSVMMAEIAMHVRQGELDQKRRYLKASKALAPVGLSWFLVLIVVAPFVLPNLLGAQWQTSGAFAAALAVSVGAGLVASPLSVVFVLYEKSVMNVGLDLGRIAVVLGTGVATWSLGYGPELAVLAMSLGMGFIYLATWLLGLRVVSHSDSKDSDSTHLGGEE